jgi:hypothetical protein
VRDALELWASRAGICWWSRTTEAGPSALRLHAELVATLTMPDVALGTLAYHVRQLVRAGLLSPAGRVQRRGAVEHLYLVTPKGAALLAGMEGLLQLVQDQV